MIFLRDHGFSNRIATLLAAILTMFSWTAGISQERSTPMPSSQPADTNDKAEIDDLLKNLETVPQRIKTATCSLKHTLLLKNPVESTTIKTGTLALDLTSRPYKFRIDIDDTNSDGIKRRFKDTYSFDGTWLYTRWEQTRSMLRREIRKQGDSLDPFMLNKGQFIIPFGNAPATVYSMFSVTRYRDCEDSQGTRGLLFWPYQNSDMASRYAVILFVFNVENGFPIRIEHKGPLDEEVLLYEFSQYKFDKPLEKPFTLERPTGYSIIDEPLDMVSGDSSK